MGRVKSAGRGQPDLCYLLLCNFLLAGQLLPYIAGTECTRLFNGLLHDVSDDANSLLLSQAQEAADCLTLYSGVPLWFHEVKSAGNIQVVQAARG